MEVGVVVTVVTFLTVLHEFARCWVSYFAQSHPPFDPVPVHPLHRGMAGSGEPPDEVEQQRERLGEEKEKHAGWCCREHAERRDCQRT